jgi:NAD(P)-dependent dehydrogenase (short-subunit alcohol dehydrogenase family)
MKSSRLAIGLGIASGMAAVAWSRRNSSYDLRGKSVFITGGSRGLGLVLAREFAKRGAKVAVCARDIDALHRAADLLREFAAPADIVAIEADMTMRDEVGSATQRVLAAFGTIDVLVNNAGVIAVGPAETMTIDDYRTSLNTHFWGPYFATMAVLPEMRRRGEGRIVNISSIGGKISVPHLLPYCVGKFALTGFSEGLRSDLHNQNIFVTTVCPGLMRTGSPRNAFFKGNNEAEYAWFSLSDSLPGISMDADRAGRQIVEACHRGTAEVVLSLPAKLAVKLHACFPAVASEVLAFADARLPSTGGIGEDVRAGSQSYSAVSPSWLTTLSEQAAVRNNEIA